MRRPIDFGSHHTAAVLENIEFLRRQGCGDEEIARRLGLKTETMKKKEERRDHKSDPTSA